MASISLQFWNLFHSSAVNLLRPSGQTQKLHELRESSARGGTRKLSRAVNVGASVVFIA